MIARILAIAGSDSGGGAGIQADIKTITLLGGHAMTAITAITAQNTLGVAAVAVLAPEMVIAQIDAVVRDIGVDAIKIGMIGSAAIAEAVADRLDAADLATVPVVFDPVMVATSGAVLADDATAAAFARLLACATIATPNLDELATLSGKAVGENDAIGSAAAFLIGARNANALLVTGIRRGGDVCDLLFRGAGDVAEEEWSAGRIETDQDHGTGCTLSSAIATGLGQGMTLPDAIGRARRYVRAALQAAPGIGAGHGPMGHDLGRTPFA